MRLTCIHGNDAAPGWKPGKTARNFHPAPSHAALHALRLSVALLPRVEARGWSIMRDSHDPSLLCDLLAFGACAACVLAPLLFIL
jgi:hypothetical protein